MTSKQNNAHSELQSELREPLMEDLANATHKENNGAEIRLLLNHMDRQRKEAADALDSDKALISELVKVLEEIASQHVDEEFEQDADPDFEYGYTELVYKARAALSKAKEQQS